MIGLIGCGNMGNALVEGIINSGIRKPHEIIVYDQDNTKTRNLQDGLGLKAGADLVSLMQEAREIFLSVKPQDMHVLLLTLKPYLRPEHLLISVAAGLNISFFEACLGKEYKIIRLMPNTPCLVGEGMIVACSNDNVEPEEEQTVIKLLGTLGHVLTLEEQYFDAVTALSGSGPAYIFLVIEALTDGGVELGLKRDVALLLASQTVLGAARMCLATGENPAILKSRITSPGGTTSAGLLALEAGAIRSSFAKAMAAAAQRSKKMGNSNRNQDSKSQK